MGDSRADKAHEKEPAKSSRKHGEAGVMQFSQQADYAVLTGLIAVETDPVTKEIYKELCGYIKQIEKEREKIERAERIYDNALDKYALIKTYHPLEKYHSKTKSAITEAYAKSRVGRFEALEGIVLLQENFANKDPKNKDKRLAVFTTVAIHILHIDQVYSVEEYKDICRAAKDELLYTRRDIYIETGDKQYKKYFDESQEKSSAELQQHWDQKIDSSLGPNRLMDIAVAKSINKTFANRLKQLYESQVNDNPIDAYHKCSDFIDDCVRLKSGGRGADLPLRSSNVVVEMMDDYVDKASVLRDDIVRRNPRFTDYNDKFILLVNEAQPFLQSVEVLMKKIQRGEMPSEYLMEKWVYPTANELLQNQHLQFLKNLIPTLDYAIQTTLPHAEQTTDRFSLMLDYCQKLETTARAALEIKVKKTDDIDDFRMAVAALLKEPVSEKKDIPEQKDAAEIAELIDEIREKYGFQVIYNITGMPQGYWGSEKVDVSAVRNALEGILRSLSKYPPSLIKYFKDNGIGGYIRNIYLTNNLRGTDNNGKQYNCKAVALPNGDIVIDLDGGERWFEFTFHHEFFHQLDCSDTFERDDENWVKQNKKGAGAYKYKSGGEANANRGFSFSNIVDVFLGKDSEDIKDFAERYGMEGGVQEDQATMGENLIGPESSRGFSPMRDLLEKAVTNLVLRKKIEITTGCQFNPATQRFSRLLTREEYKAKYGYDDYEYYAKWSRDSEDRIWMDHNYWNAIADGKPMTFKHD